MRSIFFLILVFIQICIVLISCSDSDSDSESKRIVENPYYTDMGKAFDGMDTKQLIHDTHSSWTHANVAYDNELDKVIVFYNIKDGHILVRNKVAMRFKDNNNNFSNLIVVADRMSEDISCKAQASSIAANGDYISLVAHISNITGIALGTSIYRSSDKGRTWLRSDMVANGQKVIAYCGDVSGFLVLSSGRILTLACHPMTRLVRILYSDDNGYTWHFSSVPECYKHTEPAWCELSDGTIICYLRATVGDSGYTEKVPAYFTRSFDKGESWELPIPSQSILNMNEANGHMIFHKDSKMVELIHHSRFTESDGFSSIYLSLATEEDAKQDRMGEDIRIGRLPDQTKGGDSGYIGACMSKSGDRTFFYYSGTPYRADIYYMVSN